MYNFLRKVFKFRNNTSNNVVDQSWHSIIYDQDAFSKSSAYATNIVVHRFVNLISHAVSHVPINIWYKDLHKLHPLSTVMSYPNPQQSNFDLLREIVANLLIFGNAYVLMLMDDSNIIEMHNLHPERVEAIIRNNIHVGYSYKNNDKKKVYNIDRLTGKCQILHFKNYNPSHDIYGRSPIEAAKVAIQLHNKTTDWNHSLLKHGARPSGALLFKDQNTYLTQEQFERIREQFTSAYTNSCNVGKPLLLECGLDWKDISIKPKDMDFIESKNMAAREIALAFGVPPQLLGIQGDNTYNNIQASRLSLWEETIIPILDKIEGGFTRIISLLIQQEVNVQFDKEKNFCVI